MVNGDLSILPQFTVAVVTVYLTAIVLHSLLFTLIGLVSVLALRSICAEMALAKTLHINVALDIIYELLLTTAFIVASGVIGGIVGAVIYCHSLPAIPCPQKEGT